MKNSLWNVPGSLAEKFMMRDWSADSTEPFPCPVYDMHGHMGAHYAIYFNRCEPDKMVQHLRRCGIRHLVFSHHQVLWGNMTNSQVFDIVSQYPDVLRFYVGLNPHRPEQNKRDFELYESFKPFVVGLKTLPGYYKLPATDKKYEPMFIFANEHKLPFLFHTWGHAQFNGVPDMLEVAKRYPDITFFMGHSFSGDWEGAKRVADECPNAYFELTSLPGQTGVIERLVKDIGSKRIIFGTDMPWFDELQHIGGVLSADITDEDKENILYRNVERLLGKEW